LRTGLAWQTVMDGPRPYHEPMRLLTLIEAPRERISQVIRRSEEHTSELQSRSDLVCRLLLEKKKDSERTPLMHPLNALGRFQTTDLPLVQPSDALSQQPLQVVRNNRRSDAVVLSPSHAAVLV